MIMLYFDLKPFFENKCITQLSSFMYNSKKKCKVNYSKLGPSE